MYSEAMLIVLDEILVRDAEKPVFVWEIGFPHRIYEFCHVQFPKVEGNEARPIVFLFPMSLNTMEPCI
jgi:hypothetical protein